MTTRRTWLPWVVWSVAVASYVVAVINRSTLAALGPVTQTHFGIDATTLSMFAVIQLIVYAGLQIPVGLLLDRFGATAMILVGGLLMVTGQVVMATVLDVRFAVLARVFVGAGDACTFISVMRLLPEWFSLKQIPIVSQITGLIGQGGQLISVVPVALVVSSFGWMTGFLGVAGVSLIVVILGCVVLRDSVGEGTAVERMLGFTGKTTRNASSYAGRELTGSFRMTAPPSTSIIIAQRGDSHTSSISTWRKLRTLITIPGVRLAFWVHFTPPFAVNAMLLLWGTPFLTGGVGLSTAASASLLSLAVVGSMTGSALLGPLTARFVERRVRIVQVLSVSIMGAWLVTLLWPDRPPYAMLLVMVVITAIGGPASMIAFEVVRSHAPRSYLGIATGAANMGGFIASLIAVLIIGLTLDLQGAGSPENYSMGAFRWALLMQVPIWLLGLVMIFVEQRRTEAWMRHHGRTLR